MSGFSSLARWPTCQPSSFPNKFISVTSARYLVWLPCRRLTVSSPLTATSASKPPSDNASATMSRISCSSSTTRIVTPAPCMLAPCAPRCAIGEGTRDKELCSILNTASKGPPPNECQLDFRSAASCATSRSIREGPRHARGGCAAGPSRPRGLSLLAWPTAYRAWHHTSRTAAGGLDRDRSFHALRAAAVLLAGLVAAVRIPRRALPPAFCKPPPGSTAEF